MPVRRGRGINGPRQLQLFDDAERCEVEFRLDPRGDFIRVTRAERLYTNRNRFGDTDCITDADLAAFGEAGRDDVLGGPTRSVRRGTIDLRRILAAKSTTSMTGCAAVRINDDLATREARVGCGTTFYERTAGIDQDVVAPPGAERGALNGVGHQLFDDELAYGGERYVLAVLCGHDDACDFDGCAIHVTDRHLALCIRPQPRCFPVFPKLCELVRQRMRPRDRRRHQLGRFRGCVSEHHPLITRALPPAILFVNGRSDFTGL